MVVLKRTKFSKTEYICCASSLVGESIMAKVPSCLLLFKVTREFKIGRRNDTFKKKK